MGVGGGGPCAQRVVSRGRACAQRVVLRGRVTRRVTGAGLCHRGGYDGINGTI